MIEKLLGAMIGGAIDKSDGEGGLKGALIGMVLPGLMRRMGRFGWVIGGAIALGPMLLGTRRHRPRRAARRPSVRHL